MKHRVAPLFLAGLAAASLSAAGCSGRPGTLESGFWGGTTGAATGALVGAIISNGDIAASAALGGAVGIPIGIAAGALYVASMDSKTVDERGDKIRANQAELFERQQEIERLRHSVTADGMRNEDPDPAAERYEYTGATRGNAFR